MYNSNMILSELNELKELAAQAVEHAERIKGLKYSIRDVVISKRIVNPPDQGVEVWASIAGIKGPAAFVEEKTAIERLIGILGSRSSL
jgi:hypothetical protein